MKSGILLSLLAVCSAFAIDMAGQSITASTFFKDKLIVGYSDGRLCAVENEELREFNIDIEGGISSLDANGSQCYGVSTEGYVFSSGNGSDWTVLDFNGYYDGFYEKCSFVAVAVAADRVAVLGKENSGKAVLYISTKGAIWALRELRYKDENNMFLYAEYPPLDLLYDESKDEFVVVFEGGKLMTIPSCSHCNKLIGL